MTVEHSIRDLIQPVIDRLDPTHIGTHSPECHHYHAGCLALSVERRLEQTDD